MRLTFCLSALFLFAAPLSVAPTAAVAQQQPATHAACSGSFSILRISEIKPGMMPTFLQAVAAQQAWYKKLGAPDEISLIRIYDDKTGAFSETEAMTTHAGPAERTGPPPHDAGYDAFVKLFRDSSTIKTQYLTCVTR